MCNMFSKIMSNTKWYTFFKVLIPSEMKKSKSKEPKYELLKNEDEPDNVELLAENVQWFADWDYLDIITLALKVILWCSLMAFFITLEFGAVFFIFSVFYFMFTNFRKSKKQPGEVSAYSVFNPNCEAIKGTLTGQQLENEIKFGLAGFR